MTIDSEEKAKIGLQCSVGTALLCGGQVALGILCFILVVPWGTVGRVGAWLIEPLFKWRVRRNGAIASKA